MSGRLKSGLCHRKAFQDRQMGFCQHMLIGSSQDLSSLEYITTGTGTYQQFSVRNVRQVLVRKCLQVSVRNVRQVSVIKCLQVSVRNVSKVGFSKKCQVLVSVYVKRVHVKICTVPVPVHRVYTVVYIKYSRYKNLPVHINQLLINYYLVLLLLLFITNILIILLIF